MSNEPTPHSPDDQRDVTPKPTDTNTQDLTDQQFDQLDADTVDNSSADISADSEPEIVDETPSLSSDEADPTPEFEGIDQQNITAADSAVELSAESVEPASDGAVSGDVSASDAVTAEPLTDVSDDTDISAHDDSPEHDERVETNEDTGVSEEEEVPEAIAKEPISPTTEPENFTESEDITGTEATEESEDITAIEIADETEDITEVEATEEAGDIEAEDITEVETIEEPVESTDSDEIGEVSAEEEADSSAFVEPSDEEPMDELLAEGEEPIDDTEQIPSPPIPTPPKETVAATSATPSPKQGTAQQILGTVAPVLRSGTVWTLKTSAQGLDWISHQLDRDKSESEQAREQAPEASKPQGTVGKIWAIIAPVLVTVSLTIIGSLSSVMKWGLKQLNADMPSASSDSKAEDSKAEPSNVEVMASSIWQKLLPILQHVWRLWRRLLAILRERILPESLKQLSDVTLTILAGGILVGILWLTSAITPDGKPVPTAQTETTQSTDASAKEPTIIKTPSPDQKRLTAIQEQLTEIGDNYGDDLIRSVQADNQSDRLSVMLGLDWYRLDASRQNQLVRDLFKRSQSLTFSKLDVLDFEGARVARSPVIGSKMIIFERTSDAVAEMDRKAAEEAAAAKAAAEQAAAEQAAAEKAAAEKAAAEKAAAEKAALNDQESENTESEREPAETEQLSESGLTSELNADDDSVDAEL